jgi:sigma-E factor negative regulatory protein RseA
LSAGFAQRVASRLAEEPTVVAPVRFAPQPQGARWLALSAAASVAAVALVGWLAFAPQQTAAPVPQFAKSQPAAVAPIQAVAGATAQAVAGATAQAVAGATAQAVAGATAQAVAAAPKEAAQVPPPSAADDYLLAHQAYSPRNSLQGLAPYVRTVSGEAMARKK